KKLAGGFATRGHDVLVGTRTPGNPDLVQWATTVNGKIALASFANAARHGEIVVLAVRGAAALTTLETVGADPLSGKILIDATNPLDGSEGAPSLLFVGTTDSLGERVQRAVPGAKVVKAFNASPGSQMVDPHVTGQPRLELLIAGNDTNAKQKVTEIVQSFGWSGTVDVGGIEGARWLEAAVPLWVLVGRALGTYSHVLVFGRD
ncbi:MAG: NAD(P)-binding domain-containing protein, partial [Thermoplasmata archaeon]